MSRYFKAHQGHRIARAMMNVPIKPIRQCGVFLLWPCNREWMKGFIETLAVGILLAVLFVLSCCIFGGIL